MLRLRVSAESERAGQLVEALLRTEGVERLVRTEAEFPIGEVVLSADVTPSGADRVIAVLQEHGLPDEAFLLTRAEVIAPTPVAGARRGASEGFAWIELVGEARANSRPLARYLVLMAVAGVIAATGVLSDNTILIVGAMAVGPDLFPICATCVGLVLGRWGLVRRAFATLVIGLLLIAIVAAVLSLLLDVTGVLADDFVIGEGGLGGLASTDYTTILVALAAGVAGILAFETRAGAAVGVAISVTTIPASAYLGVSFGVGEVDLGWGALGVLAINVALLILSGTLTLLVQHRAAARGAARRGGPAGTSA